MSSIVKKIAKKITLPFYCVMIFMLANILGCESPSQQPAPSKQNEASDKATKPANTLSNKNAEKFHKYNKITDYDSYFSKYTKHHFGVGFNWHHFKAQAIAESRLKKNAKSHVGAIGIMQIMPATYEEITKKNRYIKGSNGVPKWNIAAGIYYNRSIWNLFKAKRPFQDRLDFTFGSYNAGKGNIFKAQKLAKSLKLNPDLWYSIQQTLPSVTGRHSKETLGYVDKIKIIKQELK